MCLESRMSYWCNVNGVSHLLRSDFPIKSFSSLLLPCPKITVNNNCVRLRAPAMKCLAIKSSVSLYELLGIEETVSPIEIKQAYKQMARKYHPDVSPPGLAQHYTQRFISLHRAYETLSDPHRRALYDLDLAFNHAFSADSQFHHQKNMEDKCQGKTGWESQLSELKRRSSFKDSTHNTSWAARVRRQTNDQSSSSS